MFKARERHFAQVLSTHLAGRMRRFLDIDACAPKEMPCGLCVNFPPNANLEACGIYEDMLEGVLQGILQELERVQGSAWQWVMIRGESAGRLSLEQVQRLIRALDAPAQCVISMQIHADYIENGMLAGLRMLSVQRVILLCTVHSDLEKISALLGSAKGLSLPVSVMIHSQVRDRKHFIRAVQRLQESVPWHIMLWPDLENEEEFAPRIQVENAQRIEDAAQVLQSEGWTRKDLWNFTREDLEVPYDFLKMWMQDSYYGVGPSALSWYDGQKLIGCDLHEYLKPSHNTQRQVSNYRPDDVQWFQLARQLYERRFTPRMLAVIPRDASAAINRIGITDGKGDLTAQGILFFQIVGIQVFSNMFFERAMPQESRDKL